MRRLRGLSTLAVLAILFFIAAGVFVYLNWPRPVMQGLLALEDEEDEIVWLYPATNAENWDRFIEAIRRGVERLQGDLPGLVVQLGPETFPDRSTAVPQLTIRWPGASRRLVVRWYKLTSDRGIKSWTAALASRKRPPLAIIGGGSSDLARELAIELDDQAVKEPSRGRPLLLITTATADRVDPREGGSPRVDLTRLYPDRTFRFCFTNKQMADAVTQFIWSHDELRPDRDPLYLVEWQDDPYSLDLSRGFVASFQHIISHSAAQQWLWATTCLSTAGPTGLAGGVLPVPRVGSAGSGLNMATLPTPQSIESSVGTFALPNRFEARAARFLLMDLDRYKPQQRRVLVVTGQSQPCRRFLHHLVNSAPRLAQSYVVVTGDAVPFNTIYRDRHLSWPIQELPFSFVFFRHQNPVDAGAGFQANSRHPGGVVEVQVPVGTKTAEPFVTGTEDLLLFGDIFETLALGYFADESSRDAGQLADRIRRMHYLDGYISSSKEGVPLFAADGNRNSGTGEHIVWVQPRIEQREDQYRVLPEAVISIWAWSTDFCAEGASGGPMHREKARLIVSYE